MCLTDWATVSIHDNGLSTMFVEPAYSISIYMDEPQAVRKCYLSMFIQALSHSAIPKYRSSEMSSVWREEQHVGHYLRSEQQHVHYGGWWRYIVWSDGRRRTSTHLGAGWAGTNWGWQYVCFSDPQIKDDCLPVLRSMFLVTQRATQPYRGT